MKQASKFILIFMCVALFVSCGTKAVYLPDTETTAGQEENTSSIADTTSEPQESDAKESCISVDHLNEAKENNPDTVAWLRIPGTNIDNAVMQSSDNSYYLKRDETGNYSQWGSYFADYYSILIDRTSLQQNTVIYGHSQNNDSADGKKFSQLFHYLDIDFLRQNPDVYLAVGDEELTFEICAVFITDIDFYYINPTPSDEGFSEFARTVSAKNEYIFGNELTEQDKLLTLSACSHQYDLNKTGNQRIVIMAKLLPEGEASGEFTVSVNPSPERP